MIRQKVMVILFGVSLLCGCDNAGEQRGNSASKVPPGDQKPITDEEFDAETIREQQKNAQEIWRRIKEDVDSGAFQERWDESQKMHKEVWDRTHGARAKYEKDRINKELNNALVAGEYDKAKLLITDVNMPIGVRGGTPLHVLVLSIDMESNNPSRRYIESKTDGYYQIDPNYYYQIEQKVTNMLNYLIDKGADVNLRDNVGYTPLHTVAAGGASVELAKYLLEQGADVNAKIDCPPDQCHTPLHLLMTRNWSRIHPLDPDPKPLAQLLIENKAIIDVTDEQMLTPLHYAAMFGNVEGISFLCQQQAKMECKDEKGQTPLHWAVRNGRVLAVQKLMSLGADPYAKTNSNRTPLMYALHEANSEIAEIILKNMPDLEARDEMGFSPLFLAAREGSSSSVALLLKKKVDMEATVGELTALDVAAYNGQLESVEILLKNRADIGNRKMGYTPLHWASKNGHLPVVRALVKHGVSLNVMNNEGLTPMRLAELSGHSNIVQFFSEQLRNNVESTKQ